LVSATPLPASGQRRRTVPAAAPYSDWLAFIGIAAVILTTLALIWR